MTTSTELREAKPGRAYSKRLTLWNIVASWLAIAGSMWLGRDMAALITPLMVMLIAALLGVYQTIGHFDLRALAALSGKPAADKPRARKPRQEGEG